MFVAVESSVVSSPLEALPAVRRRRRRVVNCGA
jgi:hypothetical protein